MSATKLFLLYACLLLSACEDSKPYWTAEHLKIIGSLSLSNLDQAPPTPSNRFANLDKAASFGEQVFFDTRFSLNGKLSCASCHQPDRAFTDGLITAKGIRTTNRNTQTIIGAAYQTWFYWDGRKDSLWSQALVPFEAANEMASSRVKVLRTISRDRNLKQQYEALFGKLPVSIFHKNIPENAGPWGDARTRDNWFRIPKSIQKQINSAYANVGKAIGAYERKIPIPKTRFDKYAEVLSISGEQEASSLLNENEKAGLSLFIDEKRTHCLRCHNGSLFSNGDFHNIGTGNLTGPQLDFGRYLGVQAVLQDEFNCMGNNSDAKPEECNALRFLPKEIHGELQGAFKTPSIRYLNKTAPYFHDGRLSTVAEVLDHYTKKPSNGSELPDLSLTGEEKNQLIAFLATLNY